MSNSQKTQVSLNKCLFSLLRSLRWEVVRETQPAGFPAQVGGGEKHEEKYEEIRQSFFYILIVLAEVLKYSLWCCNVISVGG